MEAKLILIVEDDTIAAIIAKRIFEGLGYQVELAKDGQQAVELACQKRYAAIYMDIGLPLLNGVDASIAIRQHEANHSLTGNKAVPIIAVTANNDAAEIPRYLAAGINFVIAKPFTEAKAREFLNIDQP